MDDERLSYPEQRLKLARFLKALGADPEALMRGADLNWMISGERGDVRPLPQGWEIFLTCATPPAWADAKARFGFLVLKQNSCSGLMWVAALPDRNQASAILDVLGIKSAWRRHAPRIEARARAGLR
jgi:hypothetical protein